MPAATNKVRVTRRAGEKQAITNVNFHFRAKTFLPVFLGKILAPMNSICNDLTGGYRFVFTFPTRFVRPLTR